MNQRENLLSLLRRKGYAYVPVAFNLCPSLEREFQKRYGDRVKYYDHERFASPWVKIDDSLVPGTESDAYRIYYDSLCPGTEIDIFGIAHEPGSESAAHMTRMRHPMASMDSLEQLQSYPLPLVDDSLAAMQTRQVQDAHEQGRAALGIMDCTVWEVSWYLRGMENLMMDMMSEDPMAEFVLDAIMNLSVKRACGYARAGADIIFLGDDIGMQHSVMMSETMYVTWLKPRLQKIIQAAKEINPDILIMYHSCGFVTPFIPHLMEAGVEVLNPIQPECMSFADIHAQFGDVLSFHGTIGTQTTMPFGTPEEVRAAVQANLKIAGAAGGLLPAPTHLLEPEVPWENIEAYVQACRDYR